MEEEPTFNWTGACHSHNGTIKEIYPYKYDKIGLNIFISNQLIQYNTIFNHTNIRIRTEARAYQVLLLMIKLNSI